MTISDTEVSKRMREMRRRGHDHPLPVLLGEAPSKSGDRYWEFPLSGAVAQSLCAMAGIPPMAGGSRYGRWTWALYERFDCVNLIERWPGAQGQGSAFPLDVACEALVERTPEIDGKVVVMLGARLPKVICPQLSPFYFYDWHNVTLPRSGACTTICSIPHPSGLNRMYNGPVERKRAGVILQQAIGIAQARGAVST
jgi:hypothetical protein